MTEEQLKLLRQLDLRERFARQAAGPWTMVYESWQDQDSNGAILACFAPKRYRAEALKNTSWDLHIGDGLPSVAEYYSGGRRRRTKYLRYGNDEGLEPLVMTQDHYGIKPRQLPQLGEEFRLFHNLWTDPRGTQLIKVESD